MAQSAFIGNKPQTDLDLWIVGGMYRAAYDFTAQPSEGFTLMPRRPDDYRYNDKRTSIIVGMAIAMVIMLCFTITRLCLRFFRTGLKSGADDWVIIPAAILAIAYPTLQILMVTRGGGGKHVWDVTYEEYRTFDALGVYCKTIFFTTVGVIKISIALFIRRLSSVKEPAWRVANDILIFMLVAYTLVALFWTVFQCNPPPAMWNLAYSGKLVVPAKCWSTELMANVLSVLHVVMDFVLLATPIIFLWKVQLNKAKRVRLYLVFSLGALSCVASIVRQLAQKHINMDITYGYTSLLAWTLADLTLALVVASLPVMSALIPAVFHRLTGSSDDRSRPTGISSNITEPKTPTTRRRASDEHGILRENEIELSYTFRMKDASDGGHTATNDVKGAFVSTQSFRRSGLI